MEEKKKQTCDASSLSFSQFLLLRRAIRSHLPKSCFLVITILGFKNIKLSFLEKKISHLFSHEFTASLIGIAIGAHHSELLDFLK